VEPAVPLRGGLRRDPVKERDNWERGGGVCVDVYSDAPVSGGRRKKSLASFFTVFLAHFVRYFYYKNWKISLPLPPDTLIKDQPHVCWSVGQWGGVLEPTAKFYLHTCAQEIHFLYVQWICY